MSTPARKPLGTYMRLSDLTRYASTPNDVFACAVYLSLRDWLDDHKEEVLGRLSASPPTSEDYDDQPDRTDRRSAESGEYVTAADAEANPAGTVTEQTRAS